MLAMCILRNKFKYSINSNSELTQAVEYATDIFFARFVAFCYSIYYQLLEKLESTISGT